MSKIKNYLGDKNRLNNHIFTLLFLKNLNVTIFKSIDHTGEHS
jgi:hypothetical protein